MENKSHETEQSKSPTSNPEASRQIDKAMADERPAKIAIRELWLEQIRTFDEQYPEDDVPLYLTLSGAEARDIKLLAEHNIIKLTEIGAVAPESQHRVIAIEKDSQAVLTLQRQLPGLQIISQNFANIIAGESPLRFPSNHQHEKCCCAKIINLDFQSILSFRSEGGVIVFPVFNWIQKISLIHAEKKPQMNWCLCLTLNATINQSEIISGLIQNFLRENYRSSSDFENSCRDLLGDTIQDAILSEELLDLSRFTWEENQKILMIFVPKKISSIVHNQNWQVKTLWNLCYGGNGGQAPMVSWILSFEWDVRAASTPQTVYIDSLNEILSSAARIEDNGEISIFN